jgi:hypothetical protein
MSQVAPLHLDIPCARCGYNLHGLTPPGKCPECGFEIDVSIRVCLAGAAGVPPPQPHWLRQMIEAVAIALLSFAISIIADFALTRGPALPRWRMVGTSLLWGASLYACWKIARVEPLETAKGSRRIVAVCARIFAVAFVLLAAFLIWPTNADSGSIAVKTLQSLFIPLAVAASAAFYLRVRHVALRLGALQLAGQALILAVLSPAISQFLAYGFRTGTLGISPTTGWAGGVAFTLLNFRDWQERLFYRSWPALFTLCQIAVLIQLLVALVRARRIAAAREG